MKTPTLPTVLDVLPKARLVEVGRDFGVAVPAATTKAAQIEVLTESEQIHFHELLRALGRDELKAACRAHDLDESGRARPALAARLLDAHGDDGSPVPEPLFAASGATRHLPRAGDIARVRHRQYLVEEVVPPPEPGEATLVRLVCLDDDAQGRELEVLWELELGAEVRQPEAHGLGSIDRLDPPRHFAAYLHALRWGSVTATDARLFQAPFRAGIRLMNHQLTPLKKALELPRANLFIADDVGLGKTIEAGLVLQELLLRQRVDLVLIVCPAAICLQWRDEMAQRFGLGFEIYNRAFVARRRQERGFGVNPWTTHSRFIISYPLLRRPEYRDPLLQSLGGRAGKSLLILDEAHTVAPASAQRYAIDSRITRVVRDVAPRFENRLFLSATPHNGHSNSFSALLEVLDPQRFTRGVPVSGPAQLEAVLVRRLKSDLRALGVGQFPERQVVQIDLEHRGGVWKARWRRRSEESEETVDPPVDLAEGEPAELVLSEKLAEYTELAEPRTGRGKLVFVRLQKRLLSSIEAFARTLRLHAESVGRGGAQTALDLHLAEPDEEVYGLDDEAQEDAAGAEVAASSRALGSPKGRAARLLEKMQKLAERHRAAPDAKVLALLEWIRRHQCPAVRLGGAAGSAEERRWSGRRVIVFTDYGDTKRWLHRLLAAAFEGTEDAAERILHFHGGMSDEQREEIQRAFNAPPEEHPVRVLLATDAAREGVNLQAFCADLFHFDVPWNPAKMEQRNGRIDRTLQSAPQVRCHYFVYPQRAEDRVLEKLVGKVEIIRKELGSLGSVVMDRLAEVMEAGIRADTARELDAAEADGGRRETVRSELEAQRDDHSRLRQEIDEAGKILDRSRRLLELSPAELRTAVDVGLELAGAERLRPAPGEDPEHPQTFVLPELPPSWQETVDTLRPARRRDEPFWEWRRRPPRPVVFRALERLDATRVQLHLEHPFVQRILARFRSQGFSAHDLSRVTVVRNPYDSLVRVVAFGRLSLFGPGAARLHDELVSISAPWLESRGAGHLQPFADRAERKALGHLEELLAAAPTLEAVPEAVQHRLLASAAKDFAALWQPITEEAEALAHEAERKLRARGEEEAEALRRLLEEQGKRLEATLTDRAQLAIDFTPGEREQWEQDGKHMEQRLAALAGEIEREPAQIRGLYRVVKQRLEPVGLVYLWPETRG